MRCEPVKPVPRKAFADPITVDRRIHSLVPNPRSPIVAIILIVLFAVFLRWMTASIRIEREVAAQLAHDTIPSLDEIAK